MESFEKSIDQILKKILKPSPFTDKTQVKFVLSSIFFCYSYLKVNDVCFLGCSEKAC